MTVTYDLVLVLPSIGVAVLGSMTALMLTAGGYDRACRLALVGKERHQPDALVYCGPELPGKAVEQANPVILAKGGVSRHTQDG